MYKLDFDKEIPIKVRWLIVGAILFVLPTLILFVEQF